jgi:hypothetical protein
MIWGNDSFMQAVGMEDSDATDLDTVVPGFGTRWVLENKSECPNIVEVRERRYRVYGALAYAGNKNSKTASGHRVLSRFIIWELLHEQHIGFQRRSQSK